MLDSVMKLTIQVPESSRVSGLMVMRDGALLVSDDYNGIIYRISYKK